MGRKQGVVQLWFADGKSSGVGFGGSCTKLGVRLKVGRMLEGSITTDEPTKLAQKDVCSQACIK